MRYLKIHTLFQLLVDWTEQWYAKLGNTICIQPGQLNSFTYVTIDLFSMKFDRIVE